VCPIPPYTRTFEDIVFTDYFIGARMTRSVINLWRLFWVGPATVVVAVLAVEVVRRLGLILVEPIPPAFRFPMQSAEPLVLTAIFVTAAVIAFAVVADISAHPVYAYRRLAMGVLVVSFVPNVAAAVIGEQGSWRPALALAVMHVAAWAVTVPMVTGLTVAQVEEPD